MHRLVSLLFLTLWCAGFFWLAVSCWARVYIEFQNHIYWLTVLMLLFAIVTTHMLIKFIKLWKDVALGKVSPRLAGRVIRNILADGIFFFKTGWKG